MEKFTSRLKELRKEKKITQKELADSLGLAQSTIANYEQGIRFPDNVMIKKLADYFSVSLDYLLKRTEVREIVLTKKNYEFINKLDDLEYKNIISKKYLDELIKGDKKAARDLIIDAFKGGLDIQGIYFDILEPALKEVGFLWEKHIVDIWNEHYITDTTIEIMNEIKNLNRKPHNVNYSIILASPGGEMHNVGLKMISDILEIEGFRVIYLGSNIPTQSIINVIEVEIPDLIAFSVTMHYHLDSAKMAIAAVKNNFKNIKILVGGGAFKNEEEAWKYVGADYYYENGRDVIEILKKEFSK
ncbi:Methanogenic corrinoid protein MtbC1 [Clostridium amylolyticum]|uniref:Methanogenic corrinoid protein MtbC1 n=1 Tax=Clostridium amylolyticum TaxID=1121298 RepID=A0A1M6IR64_9CLOT|nr:cobalamin-dependent protein [Clostridium amylolyticum]SHJ36933.1 Methanogenic corrinoid protein MtbC1 [Clostridium amylolyticum]